MKIKQFSIVLALFLLVSVDLRASDIYWYLASSMAKPGKEITHLFNRRNGSGQVFLIIGGSGQLLSKIYLAKKGGIYTPASRVFLQKAEKLGVVHSYRILLKQKHVFALSASGEKKVSTFSDLAVPGVRIALGNPGTMAIGESYLRIEEEMAKGLAENIRKNTAVVALNISQIVNYLLKDVVDAGVIFDSTARANALKYVEIPEYCNQINAAYLVRLTYQEKQQDLADFEDFIFKQVGVFEKYGFKLEQNLK